MPRVRTILVVVFAALTLFACVRRGGSSRIGRRQTRQLQQQASRELGCDPRALTITPLSDRVMQVHGCGQLRDYAYAGGRHRGWYALQPVYMRAGSEMACPVQQLTVQAPTSTVRDASGCGRTARYDLVCGAIECAWMMTAHGGAWAGESGAATASASPYGSAYRSGSADGVTVTVDPAGPPAAVPGAASPPDASAGAAPSSTATTTAPAATAVVTTSGDELEIPEPPAAGSPEELLRAVLDAHRAQIHRCAGVGVISVRAAWGEDGAVTIGLAAPLAGTDAEGCVRQAVGAQRVAASASGEIVHAVR